MTFLMRAADPTSSPTLSTVAPSTGYISGGTEITLTGTNLTGASGVTVGGVSALGVVVDSGTQVRCTVPKGASVGAVDVVVTTAGGSATKTGGFAYDITSRPVYSSLVHTLVYDDSVRTYTDATAAGAVGGTYPRMAPEPSPTYNGGAVQLDSQGSAFASPLGNFGVEITTPGHDGSTGYVKKLKYSGQQFDAPVWRFVKNSANDSFALPTNKRQYAQFHVQQTYNGSSHRVSPKFFAFSYGGGSRIEIGIWDAGGSIRSPNNLNTNPLYWNVNDDGQVASYQVIGPYADSSAGLTGGHMATNGWHVYTVEYYPPQTAGDGNGIVRVWCSPAGTAPESTTKIIDCSAAGIGVTPSGGQEQYCTTAELNNLRAAQTIEAIWWGNSTAKSNGDASNIDISAPIWWRET